MAQRKRDLTGRFGKAMKNCLPDDGGADDSVTSESMEIVRMRMKKVLAGRTFRSVNDADRVVKFS